MTRMYSTGGAEPGTGCQCRLPCANFQARCTQSAARSTSRLLSTAEESPQDNHYSRLVLTVKTGYMRKTQNQCVARPTLPSAIDYVLHLRRFGNEVESRENYESVHPISEIWLVILVSYPVKLGQERDLQITFVKQSLSQPDSELIDTFSSYSKCGTVYPYHVFKLPFLRISFSARYMCGQVDAGLKERYNCRCDEYDWSSERSPSSPGQRSFGSWKTQVGIECRRTRFMNAFNYITGYSDDTPTLRRARERRVPVLTLRAKAPVLSEGHPPPPSPPPPPPSIGVLSAIHCVMPPTASGSATPSALSAWDANRLSLSTLPRVYYEAVEASSRRFLKFEGTKDETEVEKNHRIPALAPWNLSCIGAGKTFAHLASILTGVYLYNGLKLVCPTIFHISGVDGIDHASKYLCKVYREQTFDRSGIELSDPEVTAIGETKDPRHVRGLIRKAEECIIEDHGGSHQAAELDIPVEPVTQGTTLDLIHVCITRAGAPSVAVRLFPDVNSCWWEKPQWEKSSFDAVYTTLLISKSIQATDEAHNERSEAVALKIDSENKATLRIVEKRRKDRVSDLEFAHPHIVLNSHTDNTYRADAKDDPGASSDTRATTAELSADPYALQLRVLGALLMKPLVQYGKDCIDRRRTDLAQTRRDQFVFSHAVLVGKYYQGPSRSAKLSRAQSTRLEEVIENDHEVMQNLNFSDDDPNNYLNIDKIQKDPMELTELFERIYNDTSKKMKTQLELFLENIGETFQAVFMAMFREVFGPCIASVLRGSILDIEIKTFTERAMAEANSGLELAEQKWREPTTKKLEEVMNEIRQCRDGIAVILQSQAEQAEAQSIDHPAIRLLRDLRSANDDPALRNLFELKARSESMVEFLADVVVEFLKHKFVEPVRQSLAQKLREPPAQWLANVELSREDFDKVQAELLRLSGSDMSCDSDQE
ncbi:hypothetical protein SISNIDRAFT_469565 [Sistotremastrum niveocremeum HHB9708]|uniref:GED domain-containing protein n=1 Tax=Sistotremastrum niveocremeum HHB9708 TaxID=1314777 RepID=A0A164PV06_9AGAM|nr:hypothetical protein SISNIDRAFT_469565 [Sistotremastrum niveocremeum HHB9708]